jgi:hypothetical protein
MVYIVLLVLHIACGSIALLSVPVALLTAKGRANHVRAGRVYAVAMTGVFVTALPLAMITANLFLLLVAVFSFYMVFAGWRFAKNHRGRPQWVDWAAAAIMTLTGLGMWGYSAALGLSGDPQWMTMAVYGAIGLADGQFHRGTSSRRHPAPGSSPRKPPAASLTSRFRFTAGPGWRGAATLNDSTGKCGP